MELDEESNLRLRGDADATTEDPSMEIMDEEETKRLLESQQLQKLAKLQSQNLDLDALTEYPDQEDMMSQIDAIEARESMMIHKRSSRFTQAADNETLSQLNRRERVII